MFAVVEQEQCRAAPQVGDECFCQCASRLFTHAQGGGGNLDDQHRIGYGRKIKQPDAAGKLWLQGARRLHSQPRLAAAPLTGQRHEAVGRQPLGDLRDLILPPNKSA